MKIVSVCGSCNGHLGNIVNAYDDDHKALCAEFNIDNERVSNQPMGDEEFNRRKLAILNKYLPKDKVCCRTKLLTHTDSDKVINKKKL